MQEFNPLSVKAEITRRGKDIKDVAEGTTLGYSSLLKMLSPRGNPTATSLVEIANFLGVEVGLFFESVRHNSSDTSKTA